MEFNFDNIELQRQDDRISRDYLLKFNSQETYMKTYTGVEITKKLFKSPLRADRKSTCSYFMSNSGVLKMKDFSTGFCGDFMSIVMEKYNCSYYRALQIIANDFNIVENRRIVYSQVKIQKSEEKIDSNEKTLIQITVRDYTDSDLEFWGKYNITLEILNKFNVFACKHVFLNGNLLRLDPKQPTYAYYYGMDSNGKELFKIYSPYSKKMKFLNNCSYSKLQGALQLPKKDDFIVITKSMKDVMTLYSFGISAIAPHSENLFVSDSVYKKLEIRFKNIYLNYDNDLAGVSNMNKIRKKFPNIKVLMIPRKMKVKDVSDMCKEYGSERTGSFLNKVRIVCNEQ